MTFELRLPLGCLLLPRLLLLLHLLLLLVVVRLEHSEEQVQDEERAEQHLDRRRELGEGGRAGRKSTIETLLDS